jgi:hypothetical protein
MKYLCSNVMKYDEHSVLYTTEKKLTGQMMILYFNNREWAFFLFLSFFLPSFSSSPSRTFSLSPPVRAYGLALANRRIEGRILDEVVRASTSFLLHSTLFLRSLDSRAHFKIKPQVKM